MNEWHELPSAMQEEFLMGDRVARIDAALQNNTTDRDEYNNDPNVF